MEIRFPTPPKALLDALDNADKTLEYSSAVHLFYLVWMSPYQCCGVFGDGSNGCYEWFVWKHDPNNPKDRGTLEHSQYGLRRYRSGSADNPEQSGGLIVLCNINTMTPFHLGS